MKWCYVETRDVGNGDEGVLVSFDSVQVEADSDLEAYRIGRQVLDEQQAMLPVDGRNPRYQHSLGDFLNDYVTEITG